MSSTGVARCWLPTRCGVTGLEVAAGRGARRCYGRTARPLPLDPADLARALCGIESAGGRAHRGGWVLNARVRGRPALSNSQDLWIKIFSGGFGLGFSPRPFDELPVDEGRSGANQGDQVGVR